MARAAAAATAPAPSRQRPERAPAPARRRSGPVAPARRSRPAAQPRPGAPAALARFVEASTNGLLDRLLRGRLWVGCIGVLLAGIVFLNVSLLEIAHTSTLASAIDRQNSSLRMRLAALDSTERIQRLAIARGMVFPLAGDYRYLRARPRLDGARAARRITSPGGSATSAPASGSATSATAAGSTPATAPAGGQQSAAPVTQSAAATPGTTGP